MVTYIRLVCSLNITILKQNESRYPILSTIARDYLAVQGSSVPCERQFSSAGPIDDKRRGSLLPSTFEALQVTKTYYKLERARVELEERARRDAQRQQWEKDYK